MRPRRRILAVAVLAAMAGPAMAAYGSSTAVSGLRYSLTDLAPNDGIAASAEFPTANAPLPWANAELRKDRGGAAWTQTDATSTFGSAHAQISRPFAIATSTVLWGDGGLSLSASGMGSFAKNSFVGYIATAESGAHGLLALLSPFTSISWTGNYILDAWAGPAPADTDAGRQKSSSQVTVRLQDSLQDHTLDYAVHAFADLAMGPRKAHTEGLLNFTLTNNSSDYRYVLATMDARAFGAIAPIPEPSTYALMAAGLGVVGVAARRRREKAA